MQLVEANIPKEHLVFATNGAGNQIAINIDVESANHSKIYLFRYDELEPILLANSLEGLLGVDSIDEL